MKSLSTFALCSALLLGAAFPAGAAGKTEPAAPATPPPAPKAVFVIDPKFGKDPFFPKSIRLVKAAPQVTNEVVVPPPSPMFPDELRIQGFAAVGNKKLVIINGRTVEANDRWPFRLNSGQVVQVTCVEVHDKSAVLEVHGITKELSLRSDLR